jgi:hypothetical protein
LFVEIDTVAGLPFHPLVVHATVLAVPVAALLVALAGCWPWARERLGRAPVAAAALAAVLIPLSTGSGEKLERRVPETELVERHADLGGELLPWAIGLVAVAAGLWWLDRVTRSGQAMSTAIVIGAGALAVAVSLGTTVQLVRVGHSGATAVWSDTGGG